MVLTSALFTGVRVLQIVIAIPIIGMLGYFVDPFVKNRQTVPDNLLTLFIVSILAAAWAIVTFYQFHRFRTMSGPFVAIIDIAFVGAWIAGIVLMRWISDANCSNFRVPVGIQVGDNTYSGGNNWGASINRPCAMYKASWILAIINCVLFFVTAILSWTLYRSARYGPTHVSKEYTGGRRSGSTSTYSSHRRHHRHARV